MEPEKWTHTIHRNGIIFWSWNYHIMESYHGDGVIPWNHTIGIIPRRWNHSKEMESYHGIIPRTWDHTKEMESYHGIIPRRWNHTMESFQGHGIIPWDHTKAMELYQNRIIPYHTQKFSYNIHRSKQVYSK
jgi:hypothetical protein